MVCWMGLFSLFNAFWGWELYRKIYWGWIAAWVLFYSAVVAGMIWL